MSTFKILPMIKIVVLLFIIAAAKIAFSSNYVEQEKMHKFDIQQMINSESNDLLEQQQKLLNNNQLILLHAIKRGKITKKEIEIVISRHNENITWSTMYSSIRIIYDKGYSKTRLPTNTPGTVIRLPNLGRESNSYLKHIVENYYTLAKLTVFCQGSEPSHGYNGI